MLDAHPVDEVDSPRQRDRRNEIAALSFGICPRGEVGRPRSFAPGGNHGEADAIGGADPRRPHRGRRRLAQSWSRSRSDVRRGVRFRRFRKPGPPRSPCREDDSARALQSGALLRADGATGAGEAGLTAHQLVRGFRPIDDATARTNSCPDSSASPTSDSPAHGTCLLRPRGAANMRSAASSERPY